MPDKSKRFLEHGKASVLTKVFIVKDDTTWLFNQPVSLADYKSWISRVNALINVQTN
jgi:hypothetical protein